MMKKIFAVILLITFCAVLTFAQTDENWKTFAPDDEEFSVETPISLGRDRISQDGSYSRFHALFNGTYYYVFSDNLKNLYYYGEVKKLLSISQEKGVSKKLGEFEATKFEFADIDDFYHTILTVKTKNRFYTFQTISPIQNNTAVERFFESINLNEKASIEVTVSPKENKSETDVNSIPKTENKTSETNTSGGIGSGSGIGRGSGSGNGDGTGNSNQSTTTVTPTNTNQTNAISITAKPRAIYTDFARFYGIQGSVMLRVTFLANGTIGSVTPATKLPLGLTTQAIAAAKGLQFQPAMKNGVAYSVTKMVVYSFTIY